MALMSLSLLPAWQEQKVLPHDTGDIAEYFCPDRCGHNALCVKDELIIWGGYNENRGSIYCDKNTLWLYNLDLDIWQRFKPGGEAAMYRSGACSALVWPYWYIFCGHMFEGNVNDLHRLDLINLKWEAVSVTGRDISPRDKASAWAYRNRIYCFGGYGTAPNKHVWDKDEDLFSLEFAHDRGWNDQVLYFNTDKCQWFKVSCKGTKPTGRAAHSAVCVENTVYIFGGRHQSLRLNDLHCLNLETHTWSGKIYCDGAVPDGRSWHSMSKLTKTELLLFGGFDNNMQPLDDAWQLNIATLTWTMLIQNTGFPRLWHTSCITVQGDVLVFGGCTSNILDNFTQIVTSSKVLLFRKTPFSLERLCLHTLYRYNKSTQNQWNTLPRPHQDWLSLKLQLSTQLAPPCYWPNAISVMGPGLSQLSVLSETSEFVNMGRGDFNSVGDGS